MIKLYDFQTRAFDNLIDPLRKGESQLLIGGVGTGKTFVLGQVLRKLEDEGYFDFRRELLKTEPLFDILYFTKAAGVSQTQEVLLGDFKLPPNRIFITNYDQIRSTIGAMWIEWQKTLTRNLSDFIETPNWIHSRKPTLIVCDEVQALKNESSLQHQILVEYAKAGGQVLAASATPFIRPSEAKFCFLALKPNVPGFGTIKSLNWESFVNDVSGRTAPWEYNAAATERLKEYLDNEKKIVRITGVKFEKKTLTHCKLIDFANAQDAQHFASTYEEYLEELAKIDKDAPGGVFAIWVANTKFRKRAEEIKANYFPVLAQDVVSKGKQVVIGFNYIEPLEICYKGLIKLGIPEEKISVIRGGQSKQERQENIKRYQTGVSDYCLITVRAGGVALSLHHYEKNKDVCKPRYVLSPPTWSPIDVVQFLGRAHRINSISTTHQDIVWFRGTVEEKVALRASKGLKSLAKLVAQKESWSDTFSNQEVVKGSIKQLADLEKRELEENALENEDDSPAEFEVEAFENKVEDVGDSDEEPKVIELKFELVKD